MVRRTLPKKPGVVKGSRFGISKAASAKASRGLLDSSEHWKNADKITRGMGPREAKQLFGDEMTLRQLAAMEKIPYKILKATIGSKMHR
jgi:hypothetical protein